jgi:hypothetical protein
LPNLLMLMMPFLCFFFNKMLHTKKRFLCLSIVVT